MAAQAVESPANFMAGDAQGHETIDEAGRGAVVLGADLNSRPTAKARKYKSAKFIALLRLAAAVRKEMIDAAETLGTG